jgi:hypothetical protein
MTVTHSRDGIPIARHIRGIIKHPPNIQLVHPAQGSSTIDWTTVKARERKIERGDPMEGKFWIRAPDGRIFLDPAGYENWVKGR